ncbi:MAG: ABC transporter permease [Clostridia bacterium]|nr:ABC transporter permease [Clostridia bacterium]
MASNRLGRIGQIKIYLGKCFRTFVNEKGWKSLISTLIIALILAWVIGDKTFEIFESTETGLFAMICGCIWTGLFNSIQSVCRERAIIKREHKTGLHLSSYIIAHMIYEFVLCTAEGLILTIVLAIMRECPPDGIIFGEISIEFFISFTLIIFCADALGLLVSCIVRTETAAMTVMPFVLIIQLVMSGLLFVLPENAEAVKEITITKWGLCALCTSSDINTLPNRDTMEKFEIAAAKDESIKSWKDLDLTQEYDYDYDGTSENLAEAWLVLLGYSALYGGLAILFLQLVDRDKR